MKNMELFKRFIGSAIDKTLIVIIYSLFMTFVVYTPFTFPGEAGKFIYTLTVPTSDYQYIDAGSQARKYRNDVNSASGVSEYYKYRELQDSEYLTSNTMSLDLTFTLTFIFINFIYFLASELLFKAPLGKALFKYKLYDEEGNEADKSTIWKRNIIFASILLLAVGIRFVLGISYIDAILFFFLIFDASVFSKKKNLLDKLSKLTLQRKDSSAIPHETLKVIDQNIIEKEYRDVVPTDTSRYMPQNLLSMEEKIIPNNDSDSKSNTYEIIDNNKVNDDGAMYSNLVTADESDKPESKVEIEGEFSDDNSLLNTDEKATVENNDITTKDVSPNLLSAKSKRSRVKLISIIILSLCSVGCVYTYIDYLYGIRALDLVFGYAADGEYIMRTRPQNGQCYTKNSERIATIRGQDGETYYDKERVTTTNGTKLGTDSTGADWLKKDLGPIPVGDKISSYEIYGTRSYVVGYNTYRSEYYYNVPQYRVYRDYWGDLQREFTGYKRKVGYEPYYEPVYQRYNYSRCFSTYDIEEFFSVFSKDEDVYKKLLDNVVGQLENTYGLTYEEDSIKGHRAIVYDTHDEIPMRRVVFCANKRMYILETKSTHDLFQLSYGYCSNLDLSPKYKIKTGWKDYVMIPLVSFLLISFIISVIYLGRKTIKNSSAKKLAMFNILLLILSMIGICFCIKAEYMTYPAVNPGITSMLTISMFTNALAISWLFYKARAPYSVDYAVPQWMKQFVYDKFAKEKSRRLFLSFVLYPVIICIATPLCLYGLIYAVAIILLIKLTMYFKRWSEWLDADNTNK
ncbi:MAG: RDD family protein [Prevotella sp.]|nr:RDD family protein [Prevotella sp.]